MARLFWKGSISFGLVEIPVGLRTAVRRDELDFTLLDRKDLSPIGYKHYNKATGREVPHEREIRGYEFEPDNYVVLSDEELDAANVEATRAIEIVQFVTKEEIPPLHYETPYYVEPLKRDSKSYALLREVLQKTNQVGVAKVVLRRRQSVAALLVHEGVLVLELMRYAHELHSAAEANVPPPKRDKLGITKAELEMAERLVAGMTAPWDPAVFRDEYRDDVLALIEKKVESGKIHTVLDVPAPRPVTARSDVVDLMPLLKESLAAQGERRRGPARASRNGSRRHRPPARRRRKSA